MGDINTPENPLHIQPDTPTNNPHSNAYNGKIMDEQTWTANTNSLITEPNSTSTNLIKNLQQFSDQLQYDVKNYNKLNGKRLFEGFDQVNYNNMVFYLLIVIAVLVLIFAVIHLKGKRFT